MVRRCAGGNSASAAATRRSSRRRSVSTAGVGGASSGIELRGAAPDFQERLLDDVLRLFPVPQDSIRDRDRPRRVLIVQAPQRGDVAPGDAREKVPVARPIGRTGGHGGYEFGQALFNIGCPNRQGKL